jgi:hypothetical protein
MDIYTMANPLTIVLFQLLVTRWFGKVKPIRSIIVGIVIISASMALNLVPIYSQGGLRAISVVGIPYASLFIVLTIAAAAFGELFTSARMYEYVGALAPKGQEGLFLGYANLPLAIGSFTGGDCRPDHLQPDHVQGGSQALRRPAGAGPWAERAGLDHPHDHRPPFGPFNVALQPLDRAPGDGTGAGMRRARAR